ncbi:hypothetical protein [Nonomuraea dietziae]|uniref:hypothetical protein n=1 Tax=Nonomuraea dietziae TaxID=65515 RepID=UPI0031DE3A21
MGALESCLVARSVSFTANANIVLQVLAHMVARNPSPILLFHECIERIRGIAHEDSVMPVHLTVRPDREGDDGV